MSQCFPRIAAAMHVRAKTIAGAKLRGCDSEPIHLAGSIQPCGALLVFDLADDRLVRWAGDCARFIACPPATGALASELLGVSLDDFLHDRLLVPGQEPVHVGRLHLEGRSAASACAHRTGKAVVIELEPETETASAIELLQRAQLITDSIAARPGARNACEAAAAQVRAICGFDRVVVYRFNHDWSGLVVAEARAADSASFMDHRFPASDIPAQARELYTRNLLRVIADADYSPALLQPAIHATPLDMSNCFLRSVSPVHLQYMKNMGIAASMSISIIVDGALWGMIACHHRQPRGVPVHARLLCRHVGAILGTFIHSESIAEQARLKAACSGALEDLLATLRSSADPERSLRSSAKQLRAIVGCGGVALAAGGRPVATAGRVPRELDLVRIAAIAQNALSDSGSFASDCLGEEHPDLAAVASGVLAVQLDGWEPLLVLWIRPEQVEEICWAGDPGAKLGHGPEASIKTLTPRQSFATWRQTVRGHSLPWSPAEVNTARQFRSRADFVLQRHRLERIKAVLEEANARLNTLATSDPLTGLGNRRLFEERLQSEWKRSLRQGSPLALVAIDVDYFKRYNDRSGHPAGDECLRLVARALDEARRSGDVAARVGGEEFALLLPNTDADAATAVAERLRLAVESLGLDHPLHPCSVVTVSLGIAAGVPSRSDDIQSFLNRADAALYEAKAAGRNCVVAQAAEQRA